MRFQKENKLNKNYDNYLDGVSEEYTNIQLKEYYETIMDLSSDYEKYEKKVKRVESNILKIDGSFDPDHDNDYTYYSKKYLHSNTINIGTDIIRSSEILFRPYLVGKREMGVVESIVDIVK